MRELHVYTDQQLNSGNHGLQLYATAIRKDYDASRTSHARERTASEVSR